MITYWKYSSAGSFNCDVSLTFISVQLATLEFEFSSSKVQLATCFDTLQTVEKNQRSTSTKAAMKEIVLHSVFHALSHVVHGNTEVSEAQKYLKDHATTML